MLLLLVFVLHNGPSYQAVSTSIVILWYSDNSFTDKHRQEAQQSTFLYMPPHILIATRNVFRSTRFILFSFKGRNEYLRI